MLPEHLHIISKYIINKSIKDAKQGCISEKDRSRTDPYTLKRMNSRKKGLPIYKLFKTTEKTPFDLGCGHRRFQRSLEKTKKKTIKQGEKVRNLV
jgi:hypothetical protein